MNQDNENNKLADISYIYMCDRPIWQMLVLDEEFVTEIIMYWHAVIILISMKNPTHSVISFCFLFLRYDKIKQQTNEKKVIQSRVYIYWTTKCSFGKTLHL